MPLSINVLQCKTACTAWIYSLRAVNILSHPPLISGQLSSRGSHPDLSSSRPCLLRAPSSSQPQEGTAIPGLGLYSHPAQEQPTKAQAERDGFMTISLKITPEWEQLEPGFQTSGPSCLSKANTATPRNRNKNYFMDLLWPRACKNEK